jgi:hypothetical protein
MFLNPCKRKYVRIVFQSSNLGRFAVGNCVRTNPALVQPGGEEGEKVHLEAGDIVIIPATVQTT